MFASLRKRLAQPGLEVPEVNENLVDIGGELNVTTLLAAYRSGAFPWTVNPVTWWSPDPRAIIEFSTFHSSRSLLKLLRKNPFQITVNQAFDRVIELCATCTPHRRTTWITPEFIRAYKELHRAGHAHSLEVWQSNPGELTQEAETARDPSPNPQPSPTLVGGIYGVAIGGYFAGESMFHRVPNASKAALYHLVQHLRARHFTLLDIQMPTRITVQMGTSLVPRREFLQRLGEAQQHSATFGEQFLKPLT